MTQHRSTRIFALLLGTLLAVGASAQDIDTTEVAVPPDFESLQANWWTYFEGPTDEIRPRIDTFLDSVSTQFPELDVQNQGIAESTLNGIRDNFAVYVSLLDNTDVAMPSLPPPAASYSLDDLLTLAAVVREADMSATEEQLEVEREQRVFDAVSRRRDIAFKDYVGTPVGDDRWMIALRLVQTRLAQAISERRLSLLTARMESANAYVDAANDRVELAKKLLSPTLRETELEDIQSAIDAGNIAMEASRINLQVAQVAASGLDSDTAMGRSQQRLQQQRLIGAEMGVALAEVEVARLNTQLWWTTINRNLPVELQTLETEALSWSELVRDVEQRAPIWQSETENELLAVQSQSREGLDRQANNILDQRLVTAQQTLAQVGDLNTAVADLDLLTQVVDMAVLGYSGAFKSWLATFSRSAKSAFLRVTALTNTTLFSVGETPVTGGDILRVLIILAVALLLSRIVRLAISRVDSSDFSGTQASMYTVGRLTHYAIIILAVFIALTSIGLDFSSLALVAGALSVGIGFGLQSIVNNFVSGLIILFEHSLRVGDYIELDTGLTGTVKAINVRSTLINTNDNIDIVVPNSEFVTTRLQNWTLGERILRVRIPFGVAYGSDKDLVRKAALEAAADVSFTLTNMRGRETDVWLVEFGDNSLNFLLLVWVNRQGAKRPTRTRAAYLWALETKLTKYGIEIPFPQRDLHLRSGWPQNDVEKHTEIIIDESAKEATGDTA